MSWDFETEPEFQEKLDWMDTFVREEVEPLDALWGDKVYQRSMDETLARPSLLSSSRFAINVSGPAILDRSSR